MSNYRAADLPAGTRVKHLTTGRMGTVNEAAGGTVTNTEHENFGREYVDVNWDTEDPAKGLHGRTRPFVDELAVIEPPAPRFVVNQLGNGYFAVRNTITELDAATSTSRYGAQHIADALADGTMVLDSLGKAVAAQPPAPVETRESGEFGVFDEDGEFIDGPYYTRESANEQAQTYRAEDEYGQCTVREICPDHAEQPKDVCAECFADESEDEEDGDGDGDGEV